MKEVIDLIEAAKGVKRWDDEDWVPLYDAIAAAERWVERQKELRSVISSMVKPNEIPDGVP
jgi:hypothetical protein